MDGEDGSLQDWGSWFQDQAGAAMQAALGNYRMRQIIAAGGVPAVDVDGNVYTEGQVVKPKSTTTSAGGLGGLGVSSTTLMLIGAALVAVLIIK